MTERRFEWNENLGGYVETQDGAPEITPSLIALVSKKLWREARAKFVEVE